MSMPMKGFGIVVMAEGDFGIIGGTMMVGHHVIDGLLVMGSPDSECPGFIVEVTGPIAQD